MPRFDPQQPVPCALCERDVPGRLITLHHLKPKSRGGGPEVRVPVCRTCHKQVHATFSNKELAHELTSVEALRSHDRMAPFLTWVRKQAPNRTFSVATAADRRKRRRR